MLIGFSEPPPPSNIKFSVAQNPAKTDDYENKFEMQTKLRRETWRQGTTFVDDGIKKEECSVWPLTLRLPYGAGRGTS